MADPTTIPWLTWTIDLPILVGLIYLEAAYLLGVGPIRRRFDLAPSFPRGQAITFALALIITFLALESPLHELSDKYLFSAHMTQHLILTLVAAPLLLLGIPGWLLRPLLRYRAVAIPLRFLTKPLIAFALYNVVLTFSHLPVFYELALRHDLIHAIQHQTYIFTALLVWWSVCGPLPEVNRLSYPAQMLLLFFSTFPAFLVGAILTFGDRPIYATYAAAPRVVELLNALDDQRLGGLIMWVIGSVFYLVVMGIVFFTWFEREEERGRRARAELARQTS